MVVLFYHASFGNTTKIRKGDMNKREMSGFSIEKAPGSSIIKVSGKRGKAGEGFPLDAEKYNKRRVNTWKR
ncbi:MAG: hypothetical protein IJ036_01035 [Lachnospiraceae bacterium]|nr:hypothetical protein [Lachnospiraceae bacterium]